MEPEPEPEPPTPVVSLEQRQAEQDAYERGLAAGQTLNYGLVARAHTEHRDWAMVTDPVARAYGRGCHDSLSDRMAA